MCNAFIKKKLKLIVTRPRKYKNVKLATREPVFFLFCGCFRFTQKFRQYPVVRETRSVAQQNPYPLQACNNVSIRHVLVHEFMSIYYALAGWSFNRKRRNETTKRKREKEKVRSRSKIPIPSKPAVRNFVPKNKEIQGVYPSLKKLFRLILMSC
ncbi:hypothetical protein evm_000246 [Chilo suppressalis]|nr:hypothetical protein evm_000246 [Chilo suppressalis]